jgi:glycosyltransferase involved in cell wall biosynthesis
MEKISVIIPMYNAESSIIRCLTSVINQSYKGEIEIIVINDGSKDTSKELVEKFIELNKNSSIKLINKQNGGVSSARNAGMKKATGEWIAFCDSDDAWLPNKLSKQLKLCTETTKIDFLGSILSNEPIKNFFFKNFNYLTPISLNNLMYKNFFQPSTVILKKKIIDEIGFFDESQKYAEEGNYFMRIASGGFNCFLLNEKLTIYGDESKSGFGESGLSGNLVEMQKGETKNHYYALKNLRINLLTFTLARFFSISKYIRRILIVKFRK